MNEKKGFYLRWPWNVVVYVLLFVVLRIFAIPVVLLLMSAQRRNNPNGAAEGYCLSRTRKRLTWLLWALLAWGLAVSLGAVFFMGLEQDRAYWETSDYVTLAVSGAVPPSGALAGLCRPAGYLFPRQKRPGPVHPQPAALPGRGPACG